MKTMFSHVCLTLLLVIASGDLTFSQSTVAPTGSATAAATTVGRTTLKLTTPTSPTTTTSTSAPNTTTQASPTTIAPTPANTTTLAPTPANTTTLAPTPANTTTLAPTPANTTTLAPTPANTTTLAPTPANTTTLAPTPANTTTLAPTSPPLPKPQTGNYTLRANVSSTACLMARMGLQINFKQGTDTQSMNLDPGATNVSGSCSSNGSDSVLNLHSETIRITFTFTNATNRFHLRALNVVVMSGGANFTDGNNSLSLWQASVGSSYMCKKEQSDEITALLTLKTFDLQIQPFAVENNKFSTAHECAMDDTSILIPIIVGAALAGLILIVVIAYMIGRRKTYVGYQTL